MSNKLASSLEKYIRFLSLSTCLASYNLSLNEADTKKSSGLYYKNITIINDTYKVIRMVIVSDDPSCNITYDFNSYKSCDVI